MGFLSVRQEGVECATIGFTMPDVQQIERILRAVRPMLMPHYGNVAFTRKEAYANDLLTHLDVAVEEYLRTELGKLYPEIPFVGEETGGDRTATQHWLCDPIDGTALFVRGLPYCTTMLALIENGRVTMGFIYDFVTDTLFHAVRGGGAFRNGEAIHVSDRTLKYAYFCSETHMRKPENVELYLKLVERAAAFKTMNAGYEYTLLASGKIEARICFDPWGKDYDFAAGTLLVEEAGGVVANIGSTTYDLQNGNHIAANPVVYKELTEGPEALFPISV